MRTLKVVATIAAIAAVELFLGAPGWVAGITIAVVAGCAAHRGDL